MSGRGWRFFSGFVLAGALAACGGDERAAPSGRMMTEVQPSADQIAEVNRPPSVAKLSLRPRTPVTGGTIEARARAEDPDGDQTWLLYEWWIDGEKQTATESVLPLRNLARGTVIEVGVSATDGKSRSAARRTKRTIGNSPAEVVDVQLDATEPVSLDQTIKVHATAEDPDGDTSKLRYRWYVNDTATDVRSAAFSTKRLKIGDRLYVKVRANDGRDLGKAVSSEILSVGNRSPKIVSNPQELKTDGSFHYELKSMDPDGDRRFRYELKKAPAGMSLDSVLGVVSWTPGANQAGVHEVEIHVKDSLGAEGAQHFEITVSAPKVETAEGQDGQAAPPAAPERRY